MKRFFELKLRTPVDAGPPPYDRALEGLRGICALLVLYAHFFMPVGLLDPRWIPSARFWWFNLGSAAVLMFFMISGYVIGLVTYVPATGPNLRNYLWRRILRLVPIATVAVLLSWIFLPALPARTVMGNFFFLQNSEAYPWIGSFPLLPNNPNLWSLNYEVVYYAGFVVIWLLAPSLATVTMAILGILLACTLAMPSAAPFARYACGALYWLAGLAVAWCSAPARSHDGKSRWLSAALGAYALWTIGPLRIILLQSSAERWFWMTAASPHRIDFIVGCLWLFLAVTRRAPTLATRLGYLCLGWTALGLVFRCWGDSLQESDIPGTLALIASAALVRTDCSTQWLQKFAPVGAISFGIYAIGAPLTYRQRELWPWFSGSALTFIGRAIFTALLTIGLAWALERGLQPRLARLFAGKHRGKKPLSVR
jgi:peptidoglycan/LPS O-acetylase OafA/YrhL